MRDPNVEGLRGPVVPADRVARGLYWEETLSLVSGCSKVDRGCGWCWSEVGSAMRARQGNEAVAGLYRDFVDDDGRWNGKVKGQWRFLDKLSKKNPSVFVVWNDLFHEGIPAVEILRAIIKMQKAERHVVLVSTRRLQRALDIFSIARAVFVQMGKEYSFTTKDSLRNVWIGTTISTPKEEEERLGLLRELRGLGVRTFLSYEPALEALRWELHVGAYDWLIAGGLSLVGKRPAAFRISHMAKCMAEPDWFRAARDFCKKQWIPFFFKQWAACVPGSQVDLVKNGGDLRFKSEAFVNGSYLDPGGLSFVERYHELPKSRAGRRLDGVEWGGFPDWSVDSVEGAGK